MSERLQCPNGHANHHVEYDRVMIARCTHCDDRIMLDRVIIGRSEWSWETTDE